MPSVKISAVAATRWGILSTARINLAVLEGARKSDAVEVVAVGSRDKARADAYAREHGIPHAHGSYEALLADDEVDAVYISLPNSLHHEWTMRALASGKHVLCEKPYSRRAAEVEEAFDAAQRAGLVLSEAFMWRHNPQTRRLVELLPEIGEARGVRSTHAFVLTDETNVRLRAELDGGGLMDVGSYCVSAARLLAGEPERVYGEQVVGPTGVDVHFTGTLRFAGDVIAEFVCGFDFAHRELEVLGTEGTLKTLDPFTFSKGGVYLDGEELPVEPEDPYGLELENVSAAAKGEAPLLLAREDALGQARTIEALYESAEKGSPIDL
jgi:D-xylose 1-dehydrogenase (NADP+, D-xylono-1,5-lactone-forming)